MSSNTTHNLLALKIIHIEIIFFTSGSSWNILHSDLIFKTVVKTVSSQQFIHKTIKKLFIIKKYMSWLSLFICNFL